MINARRTRKRRTLAALARVGAGRAGVKARRTRTRGEGGTPRRSMRAYTARYLPPISRTTILVRHEIERWPSRWHLTAIFTAAADGADTRARPRRASDRLYGDPRPLHGRRPGWEEDGGDEEAIVRAVVHARCVAATVVSSIGSTSRTRVTSHRERGV